MSKPGTRFDKLCRSRLSFQMRAIDRTLSPTTTPSIFAPTELTVLFQPPFVELLQLFPNYVYPADPLGGIIATQSQPASLLLVIQIILI